MGTAYANAIGILTRAPSAGGKSRLFAALGRPCDAALLTALLLDTLDATATGALQRVAAVTPMTACREVAALLPPDVAVVGQRDGDLGQRMRATMEDLFAGGAERVVLIGSDLPALTSAHTAAAFAHLSAEPADLVLGPAFDGGYYLVGASRLPPVFDGIDWGSASVLAQTRAAASRAGLTVHLLEPLADVDTVDDLLRLPPGAAPRTAQWLRRNGIVSSRGSVTSDGAS